MPRILTQVTPCRCLVQCCCHLPQTGKKPPLRAFVLFCPSTIDYSIPLRFFLPPGSMWWCFWLSCCSFLALQRLFCTEPFVPQSESSCLFPARRVCSPSRGLGGLGSCASFLSMLPFREAACSKVHEVRKIQLFLWNVCLFLYWLHPYYQIRKPKTKKYFSCPLTAAANTNDRENSVCP